MKRSILLAYALLPLAFISCDNHQNASSSQLNQGLDIGTGTDDRKNAFGYRQLEQLLLDRPEMRNVLPEVHPVYKWLAMSFDKGRIGTRIYWVEDNPKSGEAAEHAPPFDGYPAYIAIDAKAKSSPLDKWTMLVFEMFNIENTDRFKMLSDLALQGKLDGDAYARKCVKLEFEAAIKARSFLLENPLPRPDPKRDILYHWIISVDNNFVEPENLWESEDWYLLDSNYVHFKKYYDEMIAPYIIEAQSTMP